MICTLPWYSDPQATLIFLQVWQKVSCFLSLIGYPVHPYTSSFGPVRSMFELEPRAGVSGFRLQHSESKSRPWMSCDNSSSLSYHTRRTLPINHLLLSIKIKAHVCLQRLLVDLQIEWQGRLTAGLYASLLVKHGPVHCLHKSKWSGWYLTHVKCMRSDPL